MQKTATKMEKAGNKKVGAGEKQAKTTRQPIDQLKHFPCYAFDSGKERRLQR